MFLAISSLEVPPDRHDELEKQFRQRSKLVDEHEGFRRLELVKQKGGNEYLLLLHWDSQEDFKAYVKHPDFDHAHGDLDEAITPGPLQQYEVLLDSHRGD